MAVNNSSLRIWSKPNTNFMNTLNKLSFIGLFAVALSLISCNKESPESVMSETEIASTGLTISQAEELANLFAPLLDSNVKPDVETRTASSDSPKILDYIDVYVENGDTLMYALNYANNAGYIIVGADNLAFPILSHSSHGTFNFNAIDENSPVNDFLEAYKETIRKGIATSDTSSEFYDNWKDLGKEGYEYEIEISPIEDIVETRGRREYSSGKPTIYPFTGEELDYWCQEGGYNYYAENNACIGCPAIAIGMLMYDTSQRILGNSTPTSPSFSYYYDAFDLRSETTGTDTALKLRQIADAIPNYDWGESAGAESGALPADIVTGLRNLGYVSATMVDYNFETLYSNLTFKGYNYFGEETDFSRGVLLGAYATYGNGGHIWFCDGYYEQAYTVTKKFLGITIKKWNEYDDRLYMNWGWGPNQGNGWYCATDDGYWSSLDYGDLYLKRLPKMYINLSRYEMPENN